VSDAHILFAEDIADPLRPQYLAKLLGKLARLGFQQDVKPALRTAVSHRPPRAEADCPAVRRPVAQRGVAGLRGSPGGNAESTEGKPPDERAASADPTERKSLLCGGTKRRIMSCTAIGHVVLDDTDIPPLVIRIGDVVGAIDPHHFPHPRQVFVAVRIVGDETALPCGHVFERGIQLTIEEGLLVMHVSLDLVVGRIRPVNDAINSDFLLFGFPRRVQGGAQRQSLENASGFARASAGLLDRGVDPHGLSVGTAVGTTGFEDLLHERFIRE